MAQIGLSTPDVRPAKYIVGDTQTDDAMALTIKKYDENVTSTRCGRATLTESGPQQAEACGLE